MNRNTLTCFVDDIRNAVGSFPDDEADAKEVFSKLAGSDPAIFFAAAIRVIAALQPSAGLRYLILMVAKDKRLSIALLDPYVCSLEEALAVTRAAAEAGAQLQASFEMALNKALQGQTSPQKTDHISRILDILAVTGDENCWNSFQVELMAYPDKIVRAKAALLIGRSTRNVSWIARRLLDRDPRVQASAVEALWHLDAEEVRPHLLSAVKSPNNRVAANAALGLYISGDASARRILLDLLNNTDPLFQLSALWAIGQTQDEHFLPVLTDLYKHATGKLRLATVGAMSRIRRRDKSPSQAAPLQVHLSQAAMQGDGVRRLAFALSCHPARDLTGIKPTEVAIWENGTSVENYQVRLVSPPVILMAGFVAPWSASEEEPYEKAMREGLRQCLAMKRRDDLWRIDRYSIEINPQASEKGPPESILPYDDSLITSELKSSSGCISDPDLLGKVLALPSPRERAAADPTLALQRQADAFAKRGGTRHIFFFLHEMSGFDLKQDAAVDRLRAIAHEGSIVLHGVCPDIAGEWALLRNLCLSTPEGTFSEVKVETMVDSLVDAYANLCSRFEVSYSLSPSAEPVNVKLKITSRLGQAEVSSNLAPPAKPVDPSPPSTPQMAA